MAAIMIDGVIPDFVCFAGEALVGADQHGVEDPLGF